MEVVGESAPCIVVVDDDDNIRTLIADFLGDIGFNVIEADSGDAALTLVRRISTIDVLLTDVRMPGTLDGIQLVKVLKRMGYRFPVVLMSGYPGTRSIEDISEILAKPFTNRQLLTKLKAVGIVA